MLRLARVRPTTLLALALSSAASAAPHQCPPRGVAPQRRSAAASTTPPLPVLPHLTNWGGPVLSNVKVVAVGWGVSGQPLADLQSFYSALAQSSYLAWLDEYGVGLGSASSVAITPANTATTLTSAGIVAELKSQIAAGHLPAPDANTYYAVHFAPGIGISDRTGTACRDYCGFHDTDQANDGTRFTYSVIPDMSTSGCDTGCGSSGTTAFDRTTETAAHELIEAATDPEVGFAGSFAAPLAWYDPKDPDASSDHAEIADICETTLPEVRISAGGAQYLVAGGWSNALDACIVDRASAITATLSPSPLHVGGLGTPYPLQFTSTAPGGGSQAVHLAVAPQPSGTVLTPQSSSTTTGSSVPVSLTLNGSLGGPFDAIVLARGETSLAYAASHVAGDDFQLGATSGGTVAAGSSIDVAIATAPTKDSNPVALSLSPSVPPGVQAVIDHTDVTSGDTATVHVTVPHGAPSGPLRVGARAQSALYTHVADTPVQVDGDDFSVSAQPGEVHQGSTATLPIQTAVVHGVAVPVDLSVSEVPAWLHVQFVPAQVQSGQTAQLQLTADKDAPLAPALITVVASNLLQTQQTTVQLKVLPPGSGCASAEGAGALALAGLFVMGLRRRRR